MYADHSHLSRSPSDGLFSAPSTSGGPHSSRITIGKKLIEKLIEKSAIIKQEAT
jgi:hypothetical protein